MITANWHTLQVKAHNPHSIVAILQTQPISSPKLGQGQNKKAETLVMLGFEFLLTMQLIKA